MENAVLPGLLPIDKPKNSIPGLSLLPNYITGQAENALLAIIDQQPWFNDLQRRVQHYGYRYDYQARQTTKELFLGALPAWLEQLVGRLQQDKIFTTAPNQIIINEYQPGQGIAPHVDNAASFGAVVASLSLGADYIMDFTHQSGRRVSRPLPACSLLVMKDAARYQWQHSIAKRKNDVVNGVKVPRQRRVSLTFRMVNGG